MGDVIRNLRKPFSVVARNVFGTITHVVTEEPVAALTFDDGPHPEFTPRLLDLLERHNARATFFMLGEAAQGNQELVRRIAGAGHAIGNHSWDHPSFPLITGRERREQLRACERAIAPYGQHLFRPPYGEQNLASRLDALWLGYKVITWNLVVGDWWDRDADRMANLLANRVRPGSVIDLHDSLRNHPSANLVPPLIRQPYFDREPMLAAVDMFLGRVGTQFRFITIPELIQRGSPRRENWYRTTLPSNGSVSS
jgi:peptidoglycan/xylan/chitin deacetylase (PgdA/CDA1 family)